MMDSYRVRLLDKFQQPLEAYLEEMKKEDIATLKSIGLTWNWLGFWSQADVNCEAIIKLHYQNNILGVIHFAVYPYPFLNGSPEYLEILHIECVPKHRRIGNPVGLW
ncbi:hypothetical protein, partial [Chroococcus sp. FPU101]|uniref:hypothetical protein n=1 Tax=Chroococcus sp. FPU101 TaxID=1974212 RepID=UPI001A8EDD62